jgi:hypothetical protein
LLPSQFRRLTVPAAALLATAALTLPAAAGQFAAAPYSVTGKCLVTKGATTSGSTIWVSTAAVAAYSTNGSTVTWAAVECDNIGQNGVEYGVNNAYSSSPATENERLVTAPSNVVVHACMRVLFASFSDGHQIQNVYSC